MNYFGHPSAAARYARSRPDVHPAIIEQARAELGLSAPLTRALDVGCGAGQSTRALQAIARQVVGSDIAPAMLAVAPRAPGLAYVLAAAEALPFAGGAFDLVSVALAFHWFERAAFLAEARRLLMPGGWLLIYNSFFLGEMEQNPAFATWSRERYLTRYPTPPRQSQPLGDAEAAEHGFTVAGRSRGASAISFSPAELADYFLTQSNMIAALEGGQEEPAAARAWLLAELEPLFAAPRAAFRFGSTIWRLRRDDA